MDSGKQDTNAAGQERILEDDCLEQQQQPNTVEVEGAGDEELVFEDVEIAPQSTATAESQQVQAGTNDPATPTSAFSDSSDEEKDGEDEEDAESDKSSEYGDLEVENSDGRMIVRSNGLNVFEGFDGSHAQHNENADETEPQAETQDDGATEDNEDAEAQAEYSASEYEEDSQEIKPSPDTPEFSPRTKKRIEYEDSRGYSYHKRPRNSAGLTHMLKYHRRNIDQDDATYHPPSRQPRDREMIKLLRDIQRDMNTDGGSRPRRPSPFSPQRDKLKKRSQSFREDHARREAAREKAERQAAEGEQAEKEQRESEQAEGQQDREISPLADAEEAASASEEPSSENQHPSATIETNGSAQNDADTEGTVETPAENSEGNPMWDELVKISKGSLSFDEDDDEDWRKELEAAERRASQTSDSRRSSAASIDLPKVTLVSAESNEAEQGAAKSEDSASEHGSINQRSSEDNSSYQATPEPEREQPAAGSPVGLNASIWADTREDSPTPAATSAPPRLPASGLRDSIWAVPEDEEALEAPAPEITSSNNVEASTVPVTEEETPSELNVRLPQSPLSNGLPEIPSTLRAEPTVRPQPTVRLPYARPEPTIRLPPPRASNGMATAIEADPPTPSAENFEEADAQPGSPIDSPEADEDDQRQVDATTQTEPQPKPQAHAQQPVKKLGTDNDYLSLAEEYLGEANQFQKCARFYKNESMRLRKERDHAQIEWDKEYAEADDLFNKNKILRRQVEQLEQEIQWWRGEQVKSDINCNEAKARVAELEAELKKKCDECVRKANDETVCDIEDLAGDNEDITGGDLEDLPKPKEGECCNGRWILLERELAKARTRANDLEEEKEQLEQKLEKVKKDARNKAKKMANHWQKYCDDQVKQWQQFAEKNEAAAERERERQEAEYVSIYLARSKKCKANADYRANVAPLSWHPNHLNQDQRNRLVGDLVGWINNAHRHECPVPALRECELPAEDLAQIINGNAVTVNGSVNALESRGLAFTSLRLVRFIQDWYQKNGIPVPPAIRYAADEMGENVHLAIRNLLRELETWETTEGVDLNMKDALRQRDQELAALSESLKTAEKRARHAAEQAHAGEIQQYSERIDELTTQAEKLLEQLNECETQKSLISAGEQQRKIEELQKQNEKLAQDLEETQAALKELEDTLGCDSDSDKDCEEQLARCRGHGEKLTSENYDLKVKLAELNAKIQGLEKQKKEQEDTIERYQLDFEDHQDTFQREGEEKDRKIRELEEKIEEIENTVFSSTEDGEEDPFTDGTAGPTPAPQNAASASPALPSPLLRGPSTRSPFPTVQGPTNRPTTPPPAPEAPSTPSPLPAPQHALLQEPPSTPNPRSPLRSPGGGTPKTPSTPGSFNLLLGYRPEGWQDRDVRWRMSPTGRQALALTRDRNLLRNQEEEAYAEMRRQAYQALTGNVNWPEVSVEKRMKNYRRLARMRFAPIGGEGEVVAAVPAAA